LHAGRVHRSRGGAVAAQRIGERLEPVDRFLRARLARGADELGDPFGQRMVGFTVAPARGELAGAHHRSGFERFL
jgi:hypothetical protein